jgi:hypothetical protein
MTNEGSALNELGAATMLCRPVALTLIQNSTRGNPPRTIADQTVDIVHEEDSRTTGVDGFVSIAHHPSTVIWLGRSKQDLDGVTDVKIVGSDCTVLVDGEICTTFGLARDVAKGVEFYVLVRE